MQLTFGRTALGSCRGRAFLALSLWEHPLKAKVLTKGLVKSIENLEMPLVSILARMEHRGMALDLPHLRRTQQAARRYLACLQELANRLFGEGLGLAEPVFLDMESPRAVATALFSPKPDRPGEGGGLGLAPPPNSTTDHGHQSANKEVLRALAKQGCRLAEVVLEYRSCRKRLESVDLVLDDRFHSIPMGVVRPGHPAPLPRLRGTFLQCKAESGRLAMTDPSLQVLPKPVPFRWDWCLQPLPVSVQHRGKGRSIEFLPTGKALLEPLWQAEAEMSEFNVRRGLVCEPGFLLLSADYCQLELRVMTHLSEDPDLLALFAEGRRDPFEDMAARWLVPPEVQPEEERRAAVARQGLRAVAKQLYYGILFGMGVSAIAENADITLAEAEARRQQLLDSLPGLAAYKAQVDRDAWASKSVTTSRRQCWLLARVEPGSRSQPPVLLSLPAPRATLACPGQLSGASACSTRGCGTRRGSSGRRSTPSSRAAPPTWSRR